MKKTTFVKIYKDIEKNYLNSKNILKLTDHKNEEIVNLYIKSLVIPMVKGKYSENLIINENIVHMRFIKEATLITKDKIIQYSNTGEKKIENKNFKNFKGEDFEDLLEKIDFVKSNYLNDFREDIFLETIKEYGVEGYYIEICHLNYTRSYFHISEKANILPSKVYNNFRDKFKDKVLYVALLKYKDGELSRSRKKNFKLPPYHIEYAIKLLFDELKNIYNLIKYIEGIRVELQLVDRMKLVWEHQAESSEIITYDSAFEDMNEYMYILSYRRNIKDIGNLFTNLKYNTGLKDILSIKAENILLVLKKAIDKKNKKMENVNKMWSNREDKLIVLQEEILSEELYIDIIKKYDKNVYNPYTEQLIAYTTIY